MPATGKRLDLALAAAKSIVSLMSGEISARRVAPAGFEIVAAFPVRRERPFVAEVSGQGQGVILLAEDDAGVSALASRVLTKEGFRVLAAADGEEAIRIFEGAGNAITVAILDEVMPKAGGKAVLEHIRRIRPTVPVILCTEYSWGAQESKVTTPVEEILAKPYEPRDLLRCVRRAVAVGA